MVALALDEEFLALVCEDDDLVRAEFDAIIEANWGKPALPPPRRPRPPTPHRDVPVFRGQHHVPADALARQRSPPLRKDGDA